MGQIMVQISVVIPVYKTAEFIPVLSERLNNVISSLVEDYEIIFIDDGSPDNSWTLIEAVSSKYQNVFGIQLSRNFGQHSAIAAGLEASSGDWVVVMDGDLQDLPEEIPKLFTRAIEGSQSVVARRIIRDDNFLKKLFSKLFYKAFAKLTGSTLTHEYGNFGIYSRNVINAINDMPESQRSFGLFAEWVGFERVEVPVSRAKRESGRSSYSLFALLRLAGRSIVSYSNKPLYFVTTLGLILFIGSIAFAMALFVRFLVFGVEAEGWTSLMVALFLNSGLIIGTLGVIGIYIGSIFTEVKRRPNYIVENETRDKL